MEQILKSVYSEIGIKMSSSTSKSGIANQDDQELLRMKYQNGKEFYFLETPPQLKEKENITSKFNSSKKKQKILRQKMVRHEQFVSKLSQGLNLLDWLQTGKTGIHQNKQHPVKISFPMGFQHVTFEGNLKGISLEGQGKYKWLDGCLEYRGEIKGGLRHGRGVMVLQDPFLFYKGYFTHGLKEGKGLLLYSSQNIFKGFFNKGLRNGFGMMAYAPEGTPCINFYSNEWNDLAFGFNRKKRKAQKFTNFFRPHMRNSLGSNKLFTNHPKQSDFKNLIQILVKAVKDDQVDGEHELRGIVLGVKKKESLNKKWSNGVLLKNGTYLNMKDQTIKDNWEHDCFVGNWR